jgi:hypothetical protein
MAKTKRRTGRAAREKTAQDIFDLWLTAAKSGLGVGKKFEKEILDEFEQRLLDAIQQAFDKGNVFDKNAERNTKQVAKDTGRICRMFTLGKTVDVDTFTLAFTFVRDNHPACPGGGGGGAWCEI